MSCDGWASREYEGVQRLKCSVIKVNMKSTWTFLMEHSVNVIDSKSVSSCIYLQA